MPDRVLDWAQVTQQQVRIYRNLLNHKMSLQTKRPGVGWRVAGYAINCILFDVCFVVSESGRQRAIREHTDLALKKWTE